MLGASDNNQSDHERGQGSRHLAELLEQPLIKEILSRLEAELDPKYSYHRAQHTRDVIYDAIAFADADGVPEEQISLLALAAAFHDAGFLVSEEDHEQHGAAMCEEAMRKAGTYTEEQYAHVRQLILDTRLVQTPQGRVQRPSCELSKYLLDADLSNLGRDDFFDNIERLKHEDNVDTVTILKATSDLLESHSWHTPAAYRYRQARKLSNQRRLHNIMLSGCYELAEHPNVPQQAEEEPTSGTQLSSKYLNFLANVPVLLNSSLDTRQIIQRAVKNLGEVLHAEAATIFLLTESAGELVFWALAGKGAAELENKKIPSKRGICGWVIEHQQSVLVRDAQNDERFFSAVDKTSGFNTRSMICTPLTARGETPLGALQILNKRDEGEFDENDLLLAERFAHQLALAIENSQLFEDVIEKANLLTTLERRKNEMITVIVHEFRTPLNVITNAADLIASGLLAKEAVKDLSQTLTTSVSKLTKLVGEIKNLSLISNEAAPVAFEKFDVPELVRSLQEQFVAVAEARSLSFHFECSPDTPCVRGDKGLISIVLNNLLANAIRFTPDGGEIRLVTNEMPGLVQFEVYDTGIGIPAEHLTAIFEKFYEVGDALQHSSGQYEFKSGGLGIGLATAKDILARHGTALEVESEVDRGSVFRFCLEVVED